MGSWQAQKLAEAKGTSVYKPELLLVGSLQQTLDFDAHVLWSDEKAQGGGQSGGGGKATRGKAASAAADKKQPGQVKSEPAPPSAGRATRRSK